MYVKKLICGATFYGVGEAVTDPEETLVVERNAVLGHEFIESLNPGTGWGERVYSEQGSQFRAELVKRNILTEDGKVHLPAVYPLLCNVIDQTGMKMLFLTEIIRVEKGNDGFYEVTLHNASGFQTVKAETIVDTTSEGLSYAPENRPIPQAKTINAYLFNDQEVTFPERIPEGMTCIQGRFPAEVIGKLQLDPTDQWAEAREKLHKFWTARPQHLQNWTLTSVAGSFDISISEEELGKRQTENWYWAPSCKHGNLLTSYDSAFQKVKRGTTP